MSTQDLEASMRKSVEATQRNFNTIRTGRANSSLLDRISVEINADVVFKATKVDGVYDKDPAKHADAVKHAQLSYQDVLSGELGVMDSTAIALCKDNNIPIVVFNLFEPGNIGRAVAGEPIGSRIGDPS